MFVVTLRGRIGVLFISLFLFQSVFFGFVVVKTSGEWDWIALFFNFWSVYFLAKQVYANKEEILLYSPNAPRYLEPNKMQRRGIFFFNCSGFVVFYGLSLVVFVGSSSNPVDQLLLAIITFTVGQVGLIGLIYSRIENKGN